MREGSRLRASLRSRHLVADSFLVGTSLLRIAGVARLIGYRRGWRRALLDIAVELPQSTPQAERGGASCCGPRAARPPVRSRR